MEEEEDLRHRRDRRHRSMGCNLSPTIDQAQHRLPCTRSQVTPAAKVRQRRGQVPKARRIDEEVTPWL